MYFLTEPRKINKHVSELAGKLNASYFGFTKISDEKLDAIAAEYGSFEEFVDRAIERTPWFEPLEHPPGLEAELQLILEGSNRKEQDLLAATLRRAILLNQRHSLLERAGLSKIRFHDLRHTCATLLLGRGVHAKFVQELLGHANITITLDTYSHVLPGMGDQTARAMEDALDKEDPPEEGAAEG
jgi:integrase